MHFKIGIDSKQVGYRFSDHGSIEMHKIGANIIWAIAVVILYLSCKSKYLEMKDFTCFNNTLYLLFLRFRYETGIDF